MVFADRNLTLSGGNFHGEYPAKVQPTIKDNHSCVYSTYRYNLYNACKSFMLISKQSSTLLNVQAVDYLAIGIHELANISERRMEKLTNAEPGTLHSTNIFLFIYFFLTSYSERDQPASFLDQRGARRTQQWLHDSPVHCCCSR